MKKKIIALAFVVCLAITAIASVSLAYFTDTDDATNVFTSGKVDITLNEDFDKDNAQLIPGVDVKKNVTISLSKDSVESYVWYTYAVPAALDNGEKVVHINHAGRNCLGYQDDKQYWEDGQTAATPKEQCWIVDYSVEKGVEIDGEKYNVYTVLYNGTLKAGEETTVGMTKVYCDPKVDFDNDTGKYTINGKNIEYDLGNVKVIVTAYAIQAATFDSVADAYNAYNSQMSGIPENAVDID